ncbi:MAG: hypothetical protein ACYSUY_07500 [Planctomycetota bacterium]|jgi:hypothetical protein
MRKSAWSRFILELSLRETPSLLILNDLRMITGSRGAISNDAALLARCCKQQNNRIRWLDNGRFISLW